MKSHHLISTAVVIVVAVMAAGVFIGAGPDKLSAIADERSAAKGPKQATNSDGGFSPYVDKNGQISLPQGYKQKWSHLGNWAVAKKPGQTIHEMHDVYTQPETIAAFNKTGKFPDGAVLVKEVRETRADQLTTGHSAWSTDMKIWFVMIKDRKERFKNSDHWGDGWGWALFEAKDPTKNVSAGYDTSCLGCHVPAEDSDWVYTYGYPELKKPKYSRERDTNQRQRRGQLKFSPTRLAPVSIPTQQEIHMKTPSRNPRRLRILIAVPTVIAIAVVIAAINSGSDSKATAAPAKADKSKSSPVQFDKDGSLIQPTGYRKWTYVGTPLTPNDMNDGKAPFPEFHSVYMNPDAYDHYEKTGDFPDGTVFVKELISVGEKEATSGKGYFMGEFSGLEVAIKDKTRFKDEPANWGYFSFGHKYPLKEKAKIQPVVSCNECHDGNADDDWVFTQYYPILRAAKQLFEREVEAGEVVGRSADHPT